jgi:hypothetical protein
LEYCTEFSLRGKIPEMQGIVEALVVVRGEPYGLCGEYCVRGESGTVEIGGR